MNFNTLKKFSYIFITVLALSTGGCLVTKQNETKVSKESEVILFDGKNLDNWEKTDFAGKGEIFIDKNGSLVLEMGAELSGLHWKGDDLPTSNYEISLQA